MLVAANQMKVSVHRLLMDPEFYLFGHEPTVPEIARMTSDDVLHRHAKDLRRRYDREARQAENGPVYRRHAAAIRDTVDWLDPACRSFRVEADLRAAAL